ncbi:MAG: segregation and condensation protein A, partial [Candidatus Methylomirabilales bacterium]
MVYQVKLPTFEGPLDLLLHLIRINQVDIYDIPIAQITDEYFQYLNLLQELDLEVAGEFLVMAATLVYIKSRMLLPEPPAEGEAIEEDPRASLVDMLLEYERFRSASEALAEREEWQRQFFFRSAPLDVPPGGATLEVSLPDLLAAFRDVLARVKDDPVLELVPRSVTTADRMVAILDRLTTEASIAFEALFPHGVTRSMVVVTFLALLEL